MFEFIRNMYRMGRINTDKVFSYVPRYITQEEA